MVSVSADVEAQEAGPEKDEQEQWPALYEPREIRTGFRVGAAGNSPRVDLPMPGVGILFEAGTSGSVVDSSSIGNFGNGLTKVNAKLKIVDLMEFDNGG